jgi:hypothetical protein
MSIFYRITLAVVAIIVYLGALFIANNGLFAPEWVDSVIIQNHFAAFTALPMAAALAYILVTLLPAGDGNLEFEAFGIKFKGASAPIVLWVVCFVVIVVATRVVWTL